MWSWIKVFFSNVEEIVVGALFGCAFIMFLGFKFTLLAAFLCAIVWRLGGMPDSYKAWRRLGVPLILTGLLLLHTHAWWSLSALLLFFPLVLGYGIPDLTDNGSVIGRWVFETYWAGETPSYTDPIAKDRIDFATRAITGFLFALVMLLPCSNLPAVLIPKMNLIGWLIGAGIVTIGYPLTVVKIE